MWLHLPSTSSNSAPVAECLASASMPHFDTSGAIPVLWVTSSGTATPRPFSWRGWKTRNWITRLSGMTLPPSTAASGVASWIASLLESRVRETPLQANVCLETTPAISGRLPADSCGTWDATGSFWKTSTASLFPTMDEKPQSLGYLESWAKTGGMRNGTWFQRPTLARAMSESVFSSWPSVSAQDGARGATPFGYDGHQGGENLHTAAEDFPPKPDQWSTPNVPNGGRTIPPDAVLTGRTMMLDGKKVQMELQHQAQAFPPEPWMTPFGFQAGNGPDGNEFATDVKKFPPEPWATSTARDADKCSHPRRPGDKTLTDDAKTFPSSPPSETTISAGYAYSALIRLLCQLYGVQTEAEFRAAPKQLNPRFVELLMGWPVGWSSVATGCGSVETASCGRQQQRHLLGCG